MLCIINPFTSSRHFSIFPIEYHTSLNSNAFNDFSPLSVRLIRNLHELDVSHDQTPKTARVRPR